MTITSLEDLISGSPNLEEKYNSLQESLNEISTDELIGGNDSVEVSLPDYLINDPQIVGYPDEETQNEIYDWVLEGLPKSNYSIKDLGCGRGDLFGRFHLQSNIDYFGIELNPNLYNVAKQKYPDIQVFNNNYFDISIESDYTVVIGTLGDDMGLDKWENFNKTLNWAISNTKQAVIFVLQRDCYGSEGYLDYPFTELFNNLGTDVKFVLDNSKLEDIYKLTVHIGGHN
jgi:hypothetical protein